MSVKKIIFCDWCKKIIPLADYKTVGFIEHSLANEDILFKDCLCAKCKNEFMALRSGKLKAFNMEEFTNNLYLDLITLD